MAKMKTLTVSGQTYTVNDPEAVSFASQVLTAGQQQTARDNIGACTEKSIQDKLCPSFTESGAVVTCDPVEGYPLEVAWETKNLAPFNEAYTLTGVVTKRFSAPLPAGTYTWSCGGYESGGDSCPNFVVFDENDTAIPGCGFMVNEQTKTFTTSHTICGVYAYSNGWAVESKEVTGTVTKLQLEKGSTATAYEPYAETATITRCGKNLLDITKGKSGTATVNGNTIRVTKNADGGRSSGNIPLRVPANTNFTLSGRLLDTNGTTTNPWTIFCITESGKYHGVTQSDVSADGTFSWSRTFTEAITRCHIQVEVGEEAGVYVEFTDLQLAFGSKTAYEPYSGGTFAPGEAVTALPGVNTIYADTGLVTVTGRLDPVAQMNKLKAAILSLGGNV